MSVDFSFIFYGISVIRDGSPLIDSEDPVLEGQVI